MSEAIKGVTTNKRAKMMAKILINVFLKFFFIIYLSFYKFSSKYLSSIFEYWENKVAKRPSDEITL
jgi:hypothetical protein